MQASRRGFRPEDGRSGICIAALDDLDDGLRAAIGGEAALASAAKNELIGGLEFKKIHTDRAQSADQFKRPLRDNDRPSSAHISAAERF
jgi:hypothetical protein